VVVLNLKNSPFFICPTIAEFVDLLSLTFVNPSLSTMIATLSCANVTILVRRINMVSLIVIEKLPATFEFMQWLAFENVFVHHDQTLNEDKNL
jgi:hypothetical protein